MGRSNIVATEKEWDLPSAPQDSLKCAVEVRRSRSRFIVFVSVHKLSEAKDVNLAVSARRNLHYSFPFYATHINRSPLESKFTQVSYPMI